MEEQNRFSRASRLSRASHSSRASFYSLEKPREIRLSSGIKNSTILNIMDIELPEQSYRGSGYMMNEENRVSARDRGSNFSRGDYQFMPHVEEKDMNRNSNYKITHQCNCHDESHCLAHHCSCFLTPRQICVIGQCCPSCIQSKNDFLRTTRGWTLQKQKSMQQPQPQEGILALIKQKNLKNLHYYKQVYANQPGMQNLIFCTCKKSHCQKKYCLCFEKGVKCGQYCICLECQNKQSGYYQDEEQEERRWERYATYKPREEGQENQIDPDIEQFMQEDARGGEFNQTMEFEPPNFDHAIG